MVYLDTDVLIHFLVEQSEEKHIQSDKIYQEVSRSGSLFMSFLVLQEASFVLSKLNVPVNEIQLNLNPMLSFNPYSYRLEDYRRAIVLAEKMGYQHFNDCLHTAIAERYCDELITYNKADFTKIRGLTTLKITLL
ncbi:type II toxin-antitoxin system VapC family toxin [Dyadobacter sp. MSC1_007]|jgi:predicted nucleic acid-binding protein|uniref:type II toxin-antitoxin system VapC family toxin n=1 Tax=Dyadobacter sp. MSC1_007 TaxID=2909264 RepID=UPI00202F0D6C|nr:PIN domain-containing protein [Dyadobacter sp. MSC1_007]